MRNGRISQIQRRKLLSITSVVYGWRGFGQPMFDIKINEGKFEGMERRIGILFVLISLMSSGRTSIATGIGKMGTVIGQDGMNL